MAQSQLDITLTYLFSVCLSVSLSV